MKYAPLLALPLLLAPVPALAAAPLSREILLLYHGPAQKELFGQTEQRAIETVLNHLGLITRYHNLADGLPAPALSASVRGVVTYLDGDAVPGARAYADWLGARVQQGQKVVLLGGLGFISDSNTGTLTPRDAWLPITRALGLSYDGDYYGDPPHIRPVPGLPLPAFERPWTEPVPYYVQATNTDPRNEVFLRLLRTDTNKTSDMGVVGDHGAVVLGADFVFQVNPITYHLNWRLDPFKLLGRALGTDHEPRPDPTTVNGRRVFFAHIDGDGFANVANRPGRPLAAEVVRDDILAHTPLPTTVSIIAREVAGKPKFEAIARSLFALKTVEAASHSYTHPFNWERSTTAREGAISDISAATSYGNVGEAGVKALTPAHEIDDSFHFIGSLLPAGKSCAMMLWSGATNPTEPFITRCDALGVPNMNGGDAKVDPLFPSYADLAPYGRRVGEHRQIFTGTANENLFTHLWTGPFDGHRKAIQTFKFQESPRRVAAVNIYYHYYACDRLAGVRALRELYHWAEAQPLAPLRASAYARMAQGFFTMRLMPDGAAAWRITDAGTCRTVRFDAETREPDVRASEHVAGFNRANGALYVHLSEPSARIVLRPGGKAQPHLQSANAVLTGWLQAERRLQTTFDGTVSLEATIAGLPPGAKPRVVGAAALALGPTGTLTLTAPAGRHTVEIQW